VGVAWTSALAVKERAVSEDIKKTAGVKGKEFWMGGTGDPVARRALEARGWGVEEKVAERLLRKQRAEESSRQGYRGQSIKYRFFPTDNAGRKNYY
jgi:hypothetical protein